MFMNLQDEATRPLSPKFVDWWWQDQLLMSWLLASMLERMLTRVVGCNFSFEIWEKIIIHFASQTWATIKQFKTQLRTIKKGSMSHPVMGHDRYRMGPSHTYNTQPKIDAYNTSTHIPTKSYLWHKSLIHKKIKLQP